MSVNPLYEYHLVIEQALEKQLAEFGLELEKAKSVVAQREVQIKETKAALAILRGEPSGKPPTEVDISHLAIKLGENAPNGWEPNWTWETKIITLLQNTSDPLSTSEMADKILSYEPWRERSKIVASVSAILSAKSKPGGMFSKREDVRGNYLYAIAGSAVDEFYDIINK